MRWEKKGLIFHPEKSHKLFKSHAALPVAYLKNDDRLRIYFSSRDSKGRSLPRYIDVDPEYPQKIIYVNEQPIFSLGKPGTFDDNGIMPSWAISLGDLTYLYYIGWNLEVTITYRLSIGLAIADGNGSFDKISEGPICDRAIDEPFFNTAPCVIKEGSTWRMWYVSCTGWEKVNGKAEPFYNVKYAESNDGIYWRKTGITCIDYDDFTLAIGKPCVFYENGIYKMIYSYRNTANYRTEKSQSYRLGYAESSDGKYWERMDRKLRGIDRSDSGWDSMMMEYCSTYLYKDKRYLIYNGNGFGSSGFGYAVSQSLS